jgi:hypothetical protein
MQKRAVAAIARRFDNVSLAGTAAAASSASPSSFSSPVRGVGLASSPRRQPPSSLSPSSRLPVPVWRHRAGAALLGNRPELTPRASRLPVPVWRHRVGGDELGAISLHYRLLLLGRGRHPAHATATTTKPTKGKGKQRQQ